MDRRALACELVVLLAPRAGARFFPPVAADAGVLPLERRLVVDAFPAGAWPSVLRRLAAWLVVERGGAAVVAVLTASGVNNASPGGSVGRALSLLRLRVVFCAVFRELGPPV